LYQEAIIADMDMFTRYMISIDLYDVDAGIFPIDEWSHHIDIAAYTYRSNHC